MLRAIVRPLSCMFAVMTALLLTPLAALACVTTESENNDRVGRADGPVCVGQPLRGELDSRRDVDWFFLDINHSGTLTVSLDHSTSNDFDWRLENDSGDLLLAGTSAAVPETGSLMVSPGRYYLRMDSYAGSGWYELDIQRDQGMVCDTPAVPPVPDGLMVWSVGSATDACPSLAGEPGLLLMGGGRDVDAAFRQRVKPHIRGGDVVVLRTTGSDGYNAYLHSLLAANAVTTLLVDSRAKANTDYVDIKVRNAEFVFIAGGNQSDYLNQWEGTRLEAAIAAVYAKGGVVGGTSAGAALLSGHIYDPDGVPGIRSSEAVSDFCHPYLNFSSGFFDVPVMQGVINDTHFYRRDRLGRLLVFMAGRPVGTTGIGIDEGTSIFFTATGQGVVDGDEFVYVMREDAQSQRVQTQCGQAVVFRDLLQYRLGAGDSFNLSTGATSVAPIRVSIDGRVSNFYTPLNPY